MQFSLKKWLNYKQNKKINTKPNLNYSLKNKRQIEEEKKDKERILIHIFNSFDFKFIFYLIFVCDICFIARKNDLITHCYGVILYVVSL